MKDAMYALDVTIKLLFLVVLCFAAFIFLKYIIDKLFTDKKKPKRSLNANEERCLTIDISDLDTNGFYIYVDDITDLYKLNRYMVNSVKIKGFVSYHDIINHLANDLEYSSLNTYNLFKDVPDLKLDKFDIPSLVDDIIEHDDCYGYHIPLPKEVVIACNAINKSKDKLVSFDFSKINEEGFYIYIDSENSKDLFKLADYMVNQVKFKGYASYHDIINYLTNDAGYSYIDADQINKYLPDFMFHSVYDLPTICDDIYPVGNSEKQYCFHIHLPSGSMAEKGMTIPSKEEE